jgi:DNA-binding HxlR family transcriptional regulator
LSEKKLILSSNGYAPNVLKADCGSRRVLDMLADTWTILVISAIKHETRRYSELQRMIEGISSKMLTQTLRKLERDGLLLRTVYPEIPPKTEYRLSPLGLTLVKILEEMYLWAEDHFSEVESARRQFDQ